MAGEGPHAILIGIAVIYPVGLLEQADGLGNVVRRMQHDVDINRRLGA